MGLFGYGTARSIQMWRTFLGASWRGANHERQRANRLSRGLREKAARGWRRPARTLRGVLQRLALSERT